ncbi:Gfo/Idh/MocA family oxidoreductase, partial [candidate division KSB1 bacterium]
KTDSRKISRRDFVKASTAAAAALVARSGGLYAAGSDVIRVGLIGCGGRGTGAGIIDCAQSSRGIELVAMGDLFQDHLDAAPAAIKSNLEERGLPVKDIYKVTPDKMFAGPDNYKKVIDSGVDMVILTTPPNFRPLYLKAAVAAGVHVFIEKPIAVDPVGVRSVLETGELAKQKGLTIVAGTQMRRFEPMRQAIRRIHDGALGEVTGGQVVRTGGAMRDWREEEKYRRAEWSELDYAIRRWLFWTWLSGDFIVEMHVHNLDIMNWVLGAHPISCMAMGGRQVRVEPEFGNIYDHFSAEYVYPNNVRIQYMGAQIEKFTYRNDQRVQGTQGSAYLDFGNTKIIGANSWEYDGAHPSPAVQEYADMIESIRQGAAINEAQQVAESTMTAILGRMSAYTGRELKWEWAMQASTLDLTPQDTPAGPAPDTSVAMPGVTELI